MTVPAVLASALLVGYAVSLWWLLRGESRTARLGVLAVCLVALTLRLVEARRYPAGYNEDEIKQFAQAIWALRSGTLTGLGVEGPLLLNVLFQAQLFPLVDSVFWAIRAYATLTSTGAAAAAFATARAMQLRVAPSLAAAAFIAVLPWSIFYGRVSIGGELVFHQLLLLAALARLIWRRGGVVELAIGAVALCLLFYDYAAGRAMTAMPLVAALLASGWKQRVYCLGIPGLAWLGFMPFAHRNPTNAQTGFSTFAMQAGFAALWAKAGVAFQAFTAPVAANSWLTVRAAAMHPTAALVLASIGALSGVRRGLFLGAGFAAGLAPAIVGWGDWVSAHRMLMAFAFVGLAAASALDLLAAPTVRRAACAAAVAVIGWQSVRFYFSEQFWSLESRWQFEVEVTGLAEQLPLTPETVLIHGGGLGYAFNAQLATHPRSVALNARNWLPVSNTPLVYAFGPTAAHLRPLYEDLFGVERVRVSYRAFAVVLEAADWSWVAKHGWTYRARCGGMIDQARVPTLAHPAIGLYEHGCMEPIRHSWLGRWEGKPMELRFATAHAATVRINGRVVGEKQPGPIEAAPILFSVLPGDTVEVEVTTGGNPSTVTATLTRITPQGYRLVTWDDVVPLAPGEATGG